MPARFDHLVVAVDALAVAADRWSGAGFPVEAGGRHPGGTENALVRGPLPAYVELIAAPPDAAGPWAELVRARPGPLAWAIAVDDLDDARAAVEAVGLAPGPVRDGARDTPDGDRLAWRMCGTDGDPFETELPFLIQWLTPMPAGAADGPVVSDVSIRMREPRSAVAALSALGFTFDPAWPLTLTEPDDLDRPVGRRPVQVYLAEGAAAGVTFDVATGWPHTGGGVEPRVLDGVQVCVLPDVRGHPQYPLMETMRALFEPQAAGLRRWPNPHLHREATDEEYSRVTDESRYRIIGARARAWLDAAEQAGVGRCEQLRTGNWSDSEAPRSRATTVLHSTAADPRPIVVAWSADFPGITIGVGAPAEVVARIPDCGCDACDCGSDDYLTEVDEVFLDAFESWPAVGLR